MLTFRSGYVARRSTATFKVAISVPRDVARLCGTQFLRFRIVSSVKPLASLPYDPNQHTWLTFRSGYVARRSTATLKVAISVPRDVARLCGIQFLRFRIVSSIKPLEGIPVRSKSTHLATLSVGLRRSEIDGHFKSVSYTHSEPTRPY